MLPRLWESDLEGIAELGGQLKSLFKTLDVTPDDIDLLIDFGPKVPAKAALPYMIDALPWLIDWRTLTVASSSFPPDMTSVGQNKIEELEREEWLAWLSLRSKQKSVKRLPAFGDYAINHPVISEVDFRLMNMSPNIRYTDSLNYVVAKGQAQPRKKKAVTTEQKTARAMLAPTEQYPKLAAMIKKHPSWKGTKFSWGDAFIDKCSRGECVGNPTDWRAVGTCHHIALVVQQIANLP
jgi:T4 beta protein